MLNDWRIECFICVAQTLNFRKAAEVLHITQPALTKQIVALEESLGVRLFDRDTTHVELTNEGHALLGPAITLLQEMRDFTDTFRRNPEVTFNYWYAYGLQDVAAAFRALRPDTTLNLLRHKMWGDTPAALRQPGYVVAGRRVDVDSVAGSVFVPLGEARLYMMVAPDNPMADLGSVTVDDIDRSDTIIRSGSQLSTREIDHPGVELEHLLGRRHFIGCDRLDEAIQVIMAGCGIAFCLMPPSMDPSPIARVPLEPFGPVEIGFGYLKQHETPDVRALAQVLVEVYRDKGLTPVLA